MSNGSEACCILGICCPPQSAQQASALSLAALLTPRLELFSGATPFHRES